MLLLCYWNLVEYLHLMSWRYRTGKLYGSSALNFAASTQRKYVWCLASTGQPLPPRYIKTKLPAASKLPVLRLCLIMSHQRTRWDGRSGVELSKLFIVLNIGAPKPVWREKSWKAYPVCPQFIAKANPTPASKLASLLSCSRIGRKSFWKKEKLYKGQGCPETNALDLV